ncbi:MAG: DsbA family protein [Hyphomonadaceae bacterium]|nr:DsbA family protein [Hyphomonadaceae bacterium]
MHRFAAALAALACLFVSACGQGAQAPAERIAAATPAPPPSEPIDAKNFNAEQQQDIRAVVRDYLTRDPSVLEEALDALAARKEAARRRELETDPRSFAVGPANASVTVVEFFDYRCPHCVEALSWVMDTMRAHPEIRFVFRELPILTAQSAEASRAAIASIKQNKYLPFHRALMSHRGDLDSGAIDMLARQNGIDVARMRRDMADPAIEDILSRNYELASEASVQGTPAFLINGVWIKGFSNPEQMNRDFQNAIRPAPQAQR